MRRASFARAALLVSAIALVPVTTAGLAAVDASSGPQFGKLVAIYRLIKANYVDSVNDDDLLKGAIGGMLASLDPHSSYLDGSSLQRLETMIDGSYSGLGLSVTMDDGAVKVISPFRGSPAEKAGIKAGDYITHLDGVLYYERDLDEAVAKMRGQAGTPIRLTIYRAGRDEPFDVTVTRGVIDLEPVTWKLDGAIGVVTVNEFSRDVGKDVNEAIKAMSAQSGSKLAGLVLDLRSNPGGSLDEAVALSDLFLDQGDIVSQRGRVASENEYYRAETVFRGDAARGLPLIVLIDAGSASASEIVAGALQDHHRAVVMGERSFGKGSVQSLITLDRSSAIKLTTARYYTPSGHSVQEGGIEPDIRVPQLSDPDARKRAERALRESDLRGHLINEIALDDKQLETDKQDDPRFKMTAEEIKAQGIEDFQLHYAIDTLRHAANPAALAGSAAALALAMGRADAERLASWIALAVPLALLGGAYISQYEFGLHPCEMCWWQRYPHFAAVALAVLANRRSPGTLLTAFAATAIAISGLIGGFHAGVEYGWWEGFTACTSNLAAGGDPLEAILNAPLVRCDVAPWSLFGISLAGWNFLISTGAALVIALLLSGTANRRGIA